MTKATDAGILFSVLVKIGLKVRLPHLNPLYPKIDFYVDLLICATSWASNHKFMLPSKIFREVYYL